MIYICIPTHNEQQTVGVVLWKLRQVLTEFPRDYQLLVGDDASTDKTLEVLEPYTRVLPLTVIHSEARQGYAATLEMLLREAVRRSEYPKRDVIITLQADFTDEPDDLVPLIKKMEAGADVAAGMKVSSEKETRTRRYARKLASFFARRQKWPEAVLTPFDGFRAYRLYAVRHALEDAAGRRLLRYDGWAGHAELLRAVLPHARRVDSVNVDHRPDRLQRERRERPFAAALQVRAMMGGVEPQGLVGVEELSRIAATASRSRDRSVARGTASAQQGNGRSRPDGRERDGRGRQAGSRRGATDETRRGEPKARRSGRPERDDATATSRGADARRDSGRRPEGGENRPQEAGRTRQPRQPRAAATGPASAERSRPPRGQQRPPADPSAAQAEALEPIDPLAAALLTDPVEAGEDAETKRRPKRRRRRRGRGGSREGSEQLGLAERGELGAGPGDPGDEPQAGAEPGAEAAEGTGEKKRRRRGGRRGGRGRRKGARAGEADGAAEGIEGGEDGSGGADAPPATTPTVEESPRTE